MKYKEFWVVDNCEEPCLAFNEKEEALSIRTYPDKYHVIEYQALLDEAEAYKVTASALQSEIEKLQKQNEKLKDALIKISIRTEIDAYRKTALNLTDDMMAIEQIVSKILKEIEEEK